MESQSTSTLESTKIPDADTSGNHQESNNIENSNSTFQAGDFVMAVKKHIPLDLNEMEIHPGDVIQVLTPVTEQDFWLTGINLTDGKRRDQKGFIPKSYVNLNVDTLNGSSSREVSETSLNKVPEESPDMGEREPVPVGTQGIAKYPYERKKNDELSFNAGDVIVVLKCIQGGWWKGINSSEPGSKVQGWFPVNLVSIPNQQPTPPTKDQLESGNIEDLQLGEAANATSPVNRSDFQKRLLVPPAETNRALSAPVFLVDEAKINSPTNPKTEDIFSDDEDFDSTLMKAKSFAEDYNSKSRASSAGRRGGPRHARAASETHFDILQEVISAKVETLQEKLGDEVYNSLPEKEKKRLHGVLELVQTERDYVRDLVIIIEVCPHLFSFTTSTSKPFTMHFNIRSFSSP